MKWLLKIETCNKLGGGPGGVYCGRCGKRSESHKLQSECVVAHGLQCPLT